MGMPLTSSMVKYGRPLEVAPASSTLAMFGWFIMARAWRSASKRASTCLVSMPGLDHLERDHAFDRFHLLGHPDHAEAAFADLLAQDEVAHPLALHFGVRCFEIGWRAGWCLPHRRKSHLLSRSRPACA